MKIALIILTTLVILFSHKVFGQNFAHNCSSDILLLLPESQNCPSEILQEKGRLITCPNQEGALLLGDKKVSLNLKHNLWTNNEDSEWLVSFNFSNGEFHILSNHISKSNPELICQGRFRFLLE